MIFIFFIRFSSSGAHAAQRKGDQLIGQVHQCKQEAGQRAGIAHFKADGTVVHDVSDQRFRRILGGRESRQTDRHIRHGERGHDLHHRAEEQLRLHYWQGDVPQLLEAVMHAVHQTCLVQRVIHTLQAGDEGQEARAKTHPQLYEDDHKQDVRRIRQPAQISIFTEDLLKLTEEKKTLTAWDIYNVATEIYKPGRTDIPAMIPQNGALAELMLSEGLPES